MRELRRQVILDTETTGLSPQQQHRIIEIGCLEMIDRELTGKQFHTYIQPDRAIDFGAQKVHGISNRFLEGKPRFLEILDPFLAFIEGAELIIHNAPFDIGFLAYEFSLANHPWNDFNNRFDVIDTLALAREKHPGQRNNLDALCKRYEVNNTHRALHGALLDAAILAQVYLAMTGGQAGFNFGAMTVAQETRAHETSSLSQSMHTEGLVVITATEEEQTAHAAYLKKMPVTLWDD